MLEKILLANLLLVAGYHIKGSFFGIIKRCNTVALFRWLKEAASSGLAPFRGIAISIRRDLEPVVHALTLNWSTGQCEGQICRVKLIKGVDYGHAKLDLLRQRILHRMSLMV